MRDSLIGLGFFITLVFLVWFVIYARGYFVVKVAAILFVPVFAVAVLLAMSSFSGWPTTQRPDGKFLYVAGIAIEPNRSEHEKGAIYLYLVPLGNNSRNPLAYRPAYNTPRSYKLPYSRQLHQAMLKAAKGTAQHQRMVLEIHKTDKGKKRPSQATKVPKQIYRVYVFIPPIAPLKQ